MTKLNPSAWPESVAFKRMLRELWRQRDYVPPAQPFNNATPLAAPLATTEADPEPDPPAIQLEGWILTTNARGDVVLRHDSGFEHTLAALPDERNDHDG